MSKVKGFWQHENGKVYAVESDSFGKIIGGAGPLDRQSLANLESYHYGTAIVDWLVKAFADGKMRGVNPKKS